MATTNSGSSLTLAHSGIGGTRPYTSLGWLTPVEYAAAMAKITV